MTTATSSGEVLDELGGTARSASDASSHADATAIRIVVENFSEELKRLVPN